jgi:hypothetical protein
MGKCFPEGASASCICLIRLHGLFLLSRLNAVRKKPSQRGFPDRNAESCKNRTLTRLNPYFGDKGLISGVLMVLYRYLSGIDEKKVQ